MGSYIAILGFIGIILFGCVLVFKNKESARVGIYFSLLVTLVGWNVNYKENITKNQASKISAKELEEKKMHMPKSSSRNPPVDTTTNKNTGKELHPHAEASPDRVEEQEKFLEERKEFRSKINKLGEMEKEFMSELWQKCLDFNFTTMGKYITP